MDAWHVLCTKPAKEISTTEKLVALAEAKIIKEAFCPLEKIRDNNRHVRIKSFFKTYIFILGNLDDGDVLFRVKQTDGLYYIPRIGGRMLIVTPSEIDYLKSLHSDDGFINLNPRAAFVPNKSTIEIIDESSSHFRRKGLYQRHLNNGDRVRILFETCYSYTLEFDERDVKVVES